MFLDHFYWFSVDHNIALYFYCWKIISCVSFSIIVIFKQKVYFLLESLDQLTNLNMGFVTVFLLLIDIYLFQLIVPLKPDSNCCNSFALS